jgi:teichuronic acid biosynthesis glycosyltransferase TuaG
LNTIESIKQQTYKNIEIVIVNDCSIEKEYYEYDWKGANVKMIHLDSNSKTIFGFGCPAYVRNKGIEETKGKYIAFCDDDDIWFPHKIELQINEMKRTGCKLSSTDGLIGNGVYNINTIYKKYLAEYACRNIHFNKIWSKSFMIQSNYMICSSVVIEKELLTKINNFRYIQYEDYDCWLRALDHTNSVYIKDACIYYDATHGYGQNY